MAQALIAELAPDRAARVAFILATSANWNETERARREDINGDHSRVLIRGTKRATRHRVVPIVSKDQRALLEFALEQAGGPGDPLFEPWQNVRRDLDAACLRIEKRLNPDFDHGPDVGSKNIQRGARTLPGAHRRQITGSFRDVANSYCNHRCLRATIWVDSRASLGQTKTLAEGGPMDRDLRKPRLATNLPAPRSLAADEMAQATREGRELRVNLDRVTVAMEAVQQSDDRIRLR